MGYVDGVSRNLRARRQWLSGGQCEAFSADDDLRAAGRMRVVQGRRSVGLLGTFANETLVIVIDGEGRNYAAMIGFG